MVCPTSILGYTESKTIVLLNTKPDSEILFKTYVWTRLLQNQIELKHD